MLHYVARRLLAAVPTLLGVSIVVFLMVRLLPGDPARVVAGLLASETDVENIRHQLGLDQPGLVQYAQFLLRLVHFDLGTSVRTGQPVVAEVLARLPWTIELAATSIAVAAVLGIAGGLVAALYHNRRLDVVMSALMLFGISMPVYWFGLMLIVVFAIKLQWLPAAGSQDPGAWILPTLTLAAFSVALIARMTRSTMLEVLRADYVRTARAKGLFERGVVYGHALRNAMLPIVTVVGHQFGTLLGGAVLTETVFGWPGMGQLLVDALFARDYPVVQGIVLTFSTLFILVNLAVDLLYSAIDPRIQYA
ncbi:MAG: ABC transporter permease [Chloroflexi bacterium]|nr:ABC transporter permease [Chloroflexota bacterium]MBV9899184.1 ABC transporter permease [Chloroflexota bacterium]